MYGLFYICGGIAALAVLAAYGERLVQGRAPKEASTAPPSMDDATESERIRALTLTLAPSAAHPHTHTLTPSPFTLTLNPHPHSTPSPSTLTHTHTHTLTLTLTSHLALEPSRRLVPGGAVAGRRLT